MKQVGRQSVPTTMDRRCRYGSLTLCKAERGKTSAARGGVVGTGEVPFTYSLQRAMGRALAVFLRQGVVGGEVRFTYKLTWHVPRVNHILRRGGRGIAYLPPAA